MPGDDTKGAPERRSTSGDYLSLAHDDYRHALQRLEAVTDSLQDDFKMLAVVLPLLSGAIAGLGGVEFGGIKVSPADRHSLTFWAFAGLATVVSAIGFRDYMRAVAFEHALYTLLRYERHFVRMARAIVPKGAGEPITPAKYFVEKFLSTLTKLVAVATAVYSIPTTIAPPIILWIQGDHLRAIIILCYTGFLAIVYIVVGQLILHRFTKLFKTVDTHELDKDEDEEASAFGQRPVAADSILDEAAGGPFRDHDAGQRARTRAPGS
jgi:hypothetical protein